jgi:putative ABC transport system permease protein
LTFTPVREQALAASSQSEDFGGLFIGFSFFLVVAALILLALLFHFGLERRATEIGVLLAVGWRPAQVRRLLIFGRRGHRRGGRRARRGRRNSLRAAILFGLVTLWSAAVAESPLQFHVTAQTLAIGGVSGILISTLVIWLAVRGQAKRPARELLEQGNELEREVAAPNGGGAGPAGSRWSAGSARWRGRGAAGQHDTSDVESFFRRGRSSVDLRRGGGGCLVSRAGRAAVSRPLTLWPWRARLRPPAPRSVAIVALLASGAFLIAAVEANKLDATRDSGNGPRARAVSPFIGESALPIVQDLNTKAGREFFGLDENSLKDVAVVSLRVHDGDDASCLNLNRAQTPRLLGVNPQELQDQGIHLHPIGRRITPPGPGRCCSENGPSGEEIPAIGDEATITWALHKKIGDTVNYTDEHGRPFKVRLVGAVANSICKAA